MHRIMVALDGSALAEAVIPTVLDLAQAINGEVVLVGVVIPAPPTWGAGTPGWGPVGTWDLAMPPVEEELEATRHYLEKVRDQMQLGDDRVTVDARLGVLPRALLEAAEAHQVDLIAMSTHGRGGLDRLVMGSVTDMLIRLAHVPILVVRPPVTG